MTISRYINSKRVPKALTIANIADTLDVSANWLIGSKEEKHDKGYRWHDLRKNPDDLPQEEDRYKGSKDVLLAIKYATDTEDEEPTYTAGYIQRGEWWCYMAHNTHRIGISNRFEVDVHTGDRVITWKEIEPFEGE